MADIFDRLAEQDKQRTAKPRAESRSASSIEEPADVEGVEIPGIPKSALGPTGKVFIHPDDPSNFSTHINAIESDPFDDGKEHMFPMLVPGQVGIRSLLEGKPATREQMRIASDYAKKIGPDKDTSPGAPLSHRVFDTAEQGLAFEKKWHDEVADQSAPIVHEYAKRGTAPKGPSRLAQEAMAGFEGTMEGVGGVASQLSTGMAAPLAGGAAGLGALATGGTADEAAQAIRRTDEKVAPYVTLQPKSEAGKAIVEKAGKVLELPTKAGAKVGETTRQLIEQHGLTDKPSIQRDIARAATGGLSEALYTSAAPYAATAADVATQTAIILPMFKGAHKVGKGIAGDSTMFGPVREPPLPPAAPPPAAEVPPRGTPGSPAIEGEIVPKPPAGGGRLAQMQAEWQMLKDQLPNLTPGSAEAIAVGQRIGQLDQMMAGVRVVNLSEAEKAPAAAPPRIKSIAEEKAFNTQPNQIDPTGTPIEGAKVVTPEEARQHLLDLGAFDEADITPGRVEAHRIELQNTENHNVAIQSRPGYQKAPPFAGTGYAEDLAGPSPELPLQTERNIVEGLRNGDVVEMFTNDISRDPDRFQYKGNVDEKGITRELSEVKEYDPELAGIIAVWKDPANGKTYAINGHNRHELAERLDEPKMLVQKLKVKTAEEARAVGALINIAEGRGTSIDAAKLIRDMGLTVEDLQKRGLSLRGNILKEAVHLAKLDDVVFRKVVNGELSTAQGAIIGRDLSPEQQIGVIKMLAEKGKDLTDKELAELVRFSGDAPDFESTQTDLFGTHVVKQSLAVEKAQISAFVKDQLAKDRRIFGRVSGKGVAEELKRGGNVIDPEENARIARVAAQLEEVFTKQSRLQGPISEVLNDGAKRIARGEDPATVKRAVFEAVKQPLADFVPGLEAADTGRVGGGPEVQQLGLIPEEEVNKPGKPGERGRVDPKLLAGGGIAAGTAGLLGLALRDKGDKGDVFDRLAAGQKAKPDIFDRLSAAGRSVPENAPQIALPGELAPASSTIEQSARAIQEAAKMAAHEGSLPVTAEPPAGAVDTTGVVVGDVPPGAASKEQLKAQVSKVETLDDLQQIIQSEGSTMRSVLEAQALSNQTGRPVDYGAIPPPLTEEPVKPGLLQTAVDYLSRPISAVAGAEKAIAEGGDLGAAISDAMAGRTKTFSGEALKAAGVPEGPAFINVEGELGFGAGAPAPIRSTLAKATARGVAGAMLDIAQDPLTYISLGTGRGLKLTSGAILNRKGAKALADEIAANTARGMTREEARSAAESTIEASGRAAGWIERGGVKFAGRTIIGTDAAQEAAREALRRASLAVKGTETGARLFQAAKKVASIFDRDILVREYADYIRDKQRYLNLTMADREDIVDAATLLFKGTTPQERNALTYAIEHKTENGGYFFPPDFGVGTPAAPLAGQPIGPRLERIALSVDNAQQRLRAEEIALGLGDSFLDDYMRHAYTNYPSPKRGAGLVRGPTPALTENLERKFPTLEEAKAQNLKPFSEDAMDLFILRQISSSRARRAQELLQQAGTKYGQQGLPFALRVKDEWWEVPGMKGASGGPIHVPRVLAEDISSLAPSAAGPLLQKFDAAQNIWKGSVTALFPGFHVRNAFTNVINAGLDVGAQALNPLRHAEAVAVMGGLPGELVTRTGEKWGYDELKRAFRTEGLEGAYGEKIGLVQTEFGKFAGMVAPLEVGRKVGNAIETEGRMLHFLASIRRGMTPDIAAKQTKKFLFDYNNLSWFEHDILKRAFPFFTFTRKNVPLQLEMLLTEPGRQSILAKAFATPGDQRSIERDTRKWPDYVSSGLAIEVGKDQQGNPLLLWGTGLPIEDLNRVIPQRREGTYLMEELTRKNFLAMMNPLAKFIVEEASNKDLFLDRPLSDVNKVYDAYGPVIEQLPDAIKDSLGFKKEITRRGDTRYTMNPRALHIVRSFVLSRLYSTVGKQFDSSKDPGTRWLNNLTGLRLGSLDAETQVYPALKQRANERMKAAAAEATQQKRALLYGERAASEASPTPDPARLEVERLREKKAQREARRATVIRQAERATTYDLLAQFENASEQDRRIMAPVIRVKLGHDPRRDVHARLLDALKPTPGH